jgi:mono/diheme cytochrome c family protein
MRKSLPLLSLCFLLLGSFSACRQDMHDQPKFQALERNDFFADHRASRPLVDGTVPRGHLDEDPAFFTGVAADGVVVERVPLAIDGALLQRGRERYDIFCSPCHDRVGTGNGMIVQRGYKQPASFHEELLRGVPDGYFFQAMTNGFGVMPSYAAQVPAADRWAIVAYLRALQLSQAAPLDELAPRDRAELGAGGER